MKYITLLLILSVFTGCSHFQKNRIDSIQVIADTKANHDTVTDVDIVFVYDDGINLPESNSAWFDIRNDLRFNGVVKVIRMRITPSLVSEVQLPEQHFLANKVLAYVNFQKNGDQPPMDITQNKNPVILLKDDNYQLSWRR